MSKASGGLAADASVPGAVLIVDDNPVALWSFSQLLQHCGVRVYEASTADGAVRSALAHRPEVVVLDNRLGAPGEMTGIEVIDALHSQSFYPTWILYSGFMDQELAVDAGRRDVFCVISLPTGDFETPVMKALAATHEGRTGGWPLLPVGQSPASPPTNAGKGASWILAACDSKGDLSNFAGWAGLVGTNERRMRDLYEQMGLAPQQVKWFMRVFRALTRTSGHVENAVTELTLGDLRTLKRLRDEAGLNYPSARIPLEQFLRSQTFVPVGHSMLSTLRSLIAARNLPKLFKR